jgi:hypothetical protein
VSDETPPAVLRTTVERRNAGLAALAALHPQTLARAFSSGGEWIASDVAARMMEAAASAEFACTICGVKPLQLPRHSRT